MNTQIKLLWLTENYFPNRGGMAQSCDRITRTLRNKGVFIHIIHFTKPDSLFKSETIQNGIFTACPFIEDSSHTFQILTNYLQQTSQIIEYDYIVAFGGYLPVLGAPVLSKWFSIPLVTLIRGNDFDSAIFSSKRRDVLFYALQNSQKICVVTKDKKQRIKKLIKESNIIYIPNGIDLNEWQVSKSDFKQAEKNKTIIHSETKKTIGIFGDLKAKKGLNFFIESIEKSGLSKNFHLILIGEIPELEKNRIQQYSFSYTILPFLDRFELIPWFLTCTAIAIPSFYDGMPNVLMEAGALGIPFIASNIDGMKDLLIDNKHGFIFHPGDQTACIQALNRFLVCTEEELNLMSKNCKKLINKYSHETEADRYIEIFSK